METLHTLKKNILHVSIDLLTFSCQYLGILSQYKYVFLYSNKNEERYFFTVVSLERYFCITYTCIINKYVLLCSNKKKERYFFTVVTLERYFYITYTCIIIFERACSQDVKKYLLYVKE